MSSMVDIAQAVAYMAHRGQVDKVGEPYVKHPGRVADLLAEDGYDDDDFLQVAWLHDVLEDSDLTEKDLDNLGFSYRVRQSVVTLTRTDDVAPENYYREIRRRARVHNDPVALVVKKADIADNTDVRRLAQLDDKTIVRLVRKYAKALDYLEGVIE